MARRLVFVLLPVIAIVAWRAGKIGDLGLADSFAARRHSEHVFDSALWRSGDSNIRGRMLADLARRHQLVGVQSTTIINLLGPSDCYVGYDDEPCYKLALDSTKNRLEFSVDHSDHV